jgi:hypothetical protein
VFSSFQWRTFVSMHLRTCRGDRLLAFGGRLLW